MILQPINDIAELCARHGVKEVILSPGSRCAPLTLAFARHSQINTRTISDERSAAFVALGIAQVTQNPVVIVCTSGTASYNYAPAVAEAYYQQVPLIVLTADRPPEWIDQLDGQTIKQQQIYGGHVKKSYQFPADFMHEDAVWHANRIVNEALNLCRVYPAGPVHINIPLREPFYPTEGEDWVYSKEVREIEQWPISASITAAHWDIISEEWSKAGKKLIVAGQGPHDEILIRQLLLCSKKQKIPVIADVISNLHPIENAIKRQDSFLAPTIDGEFEALSPDLLITFGNSVISKNLKLFLREYKPKTHWHLQLAGAVADPFQSLTRIIPIQESRFFLELNNRDIKGDAAFTNQKAYFRSWRVLEESARNKASEFFSDISNRGEFYAISECLGRLKGKVNLHLANSTAVRYANYVGLTASQHGVKVFANRGTSGIDGSSSTAVGCAMACSDLTLLITGDMAFFYDRNAFWNNYLPKNLRILVLNNHAGGIFRLIKGPDRQPELEDYFETRQPLTAEATAKEFGLEYFHSSNASDLENLLKTFLDPEGGAKVMEVETNSKQNAEVLANYKRWIKSPV